MEKRIVFVPDITDDYAHIMEIPEMDSGGQRLIRLYYLPKHYPFPKNRKVYIFDYEIDKDMSEYGSDDYEVIREDLIEMVDKMNEVDCLFLVIPEEAYSLMKDFDLPIAIDFVRKPHKNELAIVKNSYLVPHTEPGEENYPIRHFESFHSFVIENYASPFNFDRKPKQRKRLIGALTRDEFDDHIEFEPKKEINSEN